MILTGDRHVIFLMVFIYTYTIAVTREALSSALAELPHPSQLMRKSRMLARDVTPNKQTDSSPAV